MSRLTAKLLCATAALTVHAAPASAQSIDRIVAFGDSYADTGNLWEFGVPRPAAYPNGRFSNGTNFIDTMAQALNVPVDNFAIGGAYTGAGNINPVGPLGFQLQYQSFLAGGGPAAFPRVDGRFDAGDLLAISIGGNDARAYRLGGGTVAGAPAAAAIRVGEATAGLNALVNAGARNITFLAGDVGRLPEAVGQPSAAAGSAFSTAFNNGMQTTLAGFANQGVIVNYLNLNTVGDVVQANPAAFGLQSAGACPLACVTTNPELLDRYFFYVDQLHLTSKGFEIVGRYAVRQLEAPLHFQAQTDVGLETARAFGSTLLGRLDLSDARHGGNGEGGLNFYVTGNFAGRDYGRSATNLSYDLDVVGITAGAEYDAAPGAVIGAAVNYSRAKADFVTTDGKAEARAWQAGVYAGWAAAAGAFVEGYAGYGWLDFENERAAVIDRLEGESDGHAITAGAKAGYLFGVGNWRVGPVVGVQYAKAERDGYTETGDLVLTLAVSDQDVKALAGSAGVEARGEVDMGGLAVRPYVALTAEKDFEGDSRTIRYAGTAAPTIVNSFVLPSRSKDTYARLTGGASFSLGERIALQVNASSSFEQEGGNDFSGFVGVKLGF